MPRYIDADVFEKKIEEERTYLLNRGQTWAENILVKHLLNILYEQPTADVKEVVHGKWIPSRFKTLREDGWCECSVCGVGNKLYDRGIRKSDVPYIDGKPYELKNIANYCPNCGAKMDKG